MVYFLDICERELFLNFGMVENHVLVFRVFGCKCFILNNKDYLKQKMIPSSWEYLLGYSNTREQIMFTWLKMSP